MADLKISELTNLTAADPANDMIPIVDVSATPPASGSTKRISINNILACSPTATLASATITGDLTVDTSTLKVDSANNRVGIGTASPSQVLSIQGPANQAFLIADDSTATYRAIYGVDSVTGGGVLGCISNHPVIFRVNNTEQMRLNSTGNLVLKGGTAGANGVGITFPTTQVASSDANTLDDYEEGTWTGTLKGLTSDPSVAVTSTGRYTKIGRNVTIQISFEGVNTTGASGACYVTGLPFANGNVRTIGSVASYLGLTFTETLVAIVDGSGTQIDFIDTRSNSAWVQAPHNAGSGRTISASLTYTV